MHLHGRCFTWSNERETPTLVHLDRVLISIDWDEKFPNAHLRGLGTDASDHCALLLQTNLANISKPRFHFEAFWPSLDDYEQVIQLAWQRPQAPFESLVQLDSTLRALIRELQRWSSSRIGEIKEQLLIARELISQLDVAQERRQLSQAEIGLRTRYKMRLLGLSSLKRTIVR